MAESLADKMVSTKAGLRAVQKVDSTVLTWVARSVASMVVQWAGALELQWAACLAEPRAAPMVGLKEATWVACLVEYLAGWKASKMVAYLVERLVAHSAEL